MLTDIDPCNEAQRWKVVIFRIKLSNKQTFMIWMTQTLAPLSTCKFEKKKEKLGEKSGIDKCKYPLNPSIIRHL